MASRSNTTTSLANSLKDQLECPVCLDLLTDPKVLPCLHSFCSLCLEGVVAKSDVKEIIECPECRAKHELPGGEVRRLSKNFTLEKLIDLLHEHEEEEEKKKQGERETTVEREHEENKDENILFCSKHKRIQDFVCLNCHTTLCHFCLGEHSDHEISNHGDAVMYLLNEMDTLVERVTIAGERIEDCLSETQTMEDTNSTILTSCKEQMETYFNTLTDKTKAKITKYQENLKLLEERHHELSGRLEEINNSQNKQREANVQVLTQTQEDITLALSSAQEITSQHNAMTTTQIISKVSQVNQQLKSLADFQWDVTQLPPIEWCFSRNNDPLKSDIINKSCILVEGLKKAHIGANTFTVLYNDPNINTTNECHDINIIVTLPNEKECEDIKVTSLGPNRWDVMYYLPVGVVTLSSFVSARRVVTISVELGGVPAEGSPFRVPCSLTKDIILNPLL